ncbi:L-threonine dehydratase catabolic TdcB [bacterium BMS3Bbin10]|nr:L-threonine dehydratase catabolic TdcB [bacterium BMS3Bbin10]
MFSMQELEAAADVVHAVMAPTPQHNWPLLGARTRCEVWVKHENHTPIGAFKLRGGLVYLNELMASGGQITGLITATRGNHGQSIALAGRRYDMPVIIYVPLGNSAEKNRAMEAFGAELVEYGADFDESRIEADRVAAERKLHFVTAFHPWLIRGVATYALEFLSALRDLDTVYVPVGMGSGICGLIATRDLLGLKTKIVGVVAEKAPAYALSFEAGEVRETNGAATFADGMACRVPAPEALEIICRGAERIVTVSEDQIAQAIRAYYSDTHNLAEGAGAAPLAALMKERDAMRGRKVGLVLSGGNLDAGPFSTVLNGGTPELGHVA